jgi:hypothetical protein
VQQAAHSAWNAALSRIQIAGGTSDQQKVPEPGRPRPPRLQAPRPDRGRRHSLSVSLTGGNRNDVTQLLPLIDPDPAGTRPPWPTTPSPGRGVRRPRLRPRQVPPRRSWQGHPPTHRPRGEPHGSGLGRFRWVIERRQRLGGHQEEHPRRRVGPATADRASDPDQLLDQVRAAPSDLDQTLSAVGNRAHSSQNVRGTVLT